MAAGNNGSVQQRLQQQEQEQRFSENLLTLLIDCRSGDPRRRAACSTATAAGICAATVAPLLTLVGCLGNCLTAVVMLRLRPVTRQNVYLGCIAVADTALLLVEGQLNLFASRGLPWATGGSVGWMPQNAGSVGCKLTRWNSSLTYSLPQYWFAILVADRVLSMYFPFRMRLLGPRAAAKALCVAFCVALAASTPTLVLVDLWPTRGIQGFVSLYCNLNRRLKGGYALIIFNALFLRPPTVPLLAIVLLNVALLLKVVKVAKKKEKGLRSSMLVLVLSAVQLVSAAPHAVVNAVLFTFQFVLVAPSVETVFRFMAMSHLLMVTGTVSLLGSATNWIVLLVRNPEFRSGLAALLQRSSRKTDDG